MGVSLLSAFGDLDYPQAPFVTVLDATQIAKEYGDASALGSGLIVDGLRAFGNDLWKACDAVFSPERIQDDEQKDWVRRAKQFSRRYFASDLVMSHALKHIQILKNWLDISREWKDIDWETVSEENETLVFADTLGAQACSSGQCELNI